MVHLRRGQRPDDVEGTLSLGAHAAEFAEEDGGEPTVIPLTAIASAKRLWGSPVLMVRWRDSSGRRETAFYFAPPPPLEPHKPSAEELTRVSAASMFRRDTKRKRRRDNTSYLASFSTDLRPAIEAWVADIRAAIASERGEGA
jgi:hypothetical protein